jgi:hypothetical protein
VAAVILLGRASELTTRRKSTEEREEIPAPPCEIYRERGGAEGRALGYWLQAELELERLLRQQHTSEETSSNMSRDEERGRTSKLPQKFETKSRNSKESRSDKR